MAIQMRRGNKANLDTSRLVAGEIVDATDEDYIGVAKAPSNVIQLATKSDIDNIPQPTVVGKVLTFGSN